MNITFGIITNKFVSDEVLNSIHNQNIPVYEIIVVGGEDKYWINKQIDLYIPFTDEDKPYTIKKNLITENASFDNIVYLHDYYFFLEDWYHGFKKFGDDWDICMNVVKNKDGSRFRDWCVYDDPNLNWPYGDEPINFDDTHRLMLPPYSYDKKKFMYISGGYWLAKKYVMEEEPLNEKLGWGESEDVEWSKRVLNKFSYKMNTYSTVQTLKDKRLSAEYVN